MTEAASNASGAGLRIASALFEIEAGDPSKRSRLVLHCVCVLFLLLLAWAMFAKLDIVAVAPGRLVPQTYVKIVQPAESGIVREILVAEGERIEKGQVLVRLDPTLNAAEGGAITRELELQRLQLRRIEAQLGGRSMKAEPGDDPLLFGQVQAQAQADEQAILAAVSQEAAARERVLSELAAAEEVVAKLETVLPSYERAAKAYERLATDNLVGELQAEERRRDVIEKAQDLAAQRASAQALRAAVAQHEKRIAQLKNERASELNQQRLEAVEAITRLEAQDKRLAFQGGLLELRAPQAGIVKELATTTVGAVVQPGTVLISLVPHNEPLLAEVMIENKDIGFVAVGQVVRLKLAPFQFQKYGMLEGVVKTISADSSAPDDATASDRPFPEDSSSVFKAVIELKAQHLESGELQLPLAAGMQASAEIVQGRRTVLEYLLSPVQRVTSEAGMER